MDFERVFTLILDEFSRQQTRYALIGGFALGLYGVARATVDLDFLIHGDDLCRVDPMLQNLSYERGYCSENVSQYVSPLAVFGEIDFLHAFRPISLAMLADLREQSNASE